MTNVLVLALDTTTRAGSAAVLEDDRLLALVEGDPSRTHGERLPGELETTLARAGVDRAAIDLLVVASGPGAFTGLRIGLAAVQGLAMVLGKRVAGVSALQALAYAAWAELGVPRDSRVAVWMDAQRGEVFTAAYDFSPDEPHEVIPPAVGLPADMLARHEGKMISFVGDGAVKHRGMIENANREWRVARRVPPLAPSVGRLGQLLASRGEAGPPHALRPLYVRRPDAELDRDRQPEATRQKS